MSVTKFYFSITPWEERKSANYTPAGDPDGAGRTVDAYGRLAEFGAPPPPVKLLETDGTNTYIHYAGTAAVIKIEEV